MSRAGSSRGRSRSRHPDGSLDVHHLPRLEAESAELAAQHDPHVSVHVVGRGETANVVMKLVPGSATVGLNFRELHPTR